MDNKKQIAIRIDAKLKQRVHAKAIANGETVTDIVLRALVSYDKKNKMDI